MNYQRANLPQDPNAKAGAVMAASQTAVAIRDPYMSSVGYYGVPQMEAGSNFRLDLLEYLNIAIKRRWLILSIVGAALVIAVLRTLMQTPLYTSTVRLQIDPQATKIVESGNITPYEGPDLEFQRTQYDLLQGRTMAERVASTLKLGVDPDFFQPREFSIMGFVKGLLGFGGAARGQAVKSQPRRSECVRRRALCWPIAPWSRSSGHAWSTSITPIRIRPGRKGWRAALPMRSLLRIWTNGSRPIPTPKPFLRINSRN